MPYLIKSVNGKRSCSVVGSREGASTIKNELIEALKGLTFHFEVRIADVTEGLSASGQDDTHQPKHADQSNITSKNDGLLENNMEREEIRLPSVKKVDFHEPTPTSLTQMTTPLEGEPTSAPIHDVDLKPKMETVYEPSLNPVLKSSLSFTPIQAIRNGYRYPINDLKNKISTDTDDKIQPDYIERSSEISKDESILQSQPMSSSAVRPNETIEPAAEKIARNTVASMMKIKEKIDQEEPSNECSYIHGKLPIGSDVETIYLSDDSKIPEAVYISSDNSKVLQITELCDAIKGMLEKSEPPSLINMGDLVLAKSMDDDCWYRSIITAVNSSKVEVLFFDWGIQEILERTRVRALEHPDLVTEKVPGLAVKAFIKELPDEAKEGNEFYVHIDSYNEYEKMYIGKYLASKE